MTPKNTPASTPQIHQTNSLWQERSGALHGIFFALFSAFVSEALLANFSLFDANTLIKALSRLLISFLTLYTLHRFATFTFRNYKPQVKDLFCITLVLIGCLMMVGLGRLISLSLATYLNTTSFFSKIHPEVFYFAIPYAAGGMVLQAVLGLHYGMVYAVALTLIVALYTPQQPLFACYVLSTTLVACFSLFRIRSRSSYVRAGFHVSLISFPFAMAMVVASNNMFSASALVILFSSLAGGFICTLLASGIAPVVEYLGGYVTDIRLIEMATLDHPLLKELSIQAPGTWNHSMVMGMMVESASDSIGANPILARVGAYFHDIGKIKKPLYFAENQIPGENRHDKLSTSMSALIIRSHVKDGIELSRKHKLPKALEDLIPQHHGTSRIDYFYDKALKEAEEEGKTPQEVDESLYHYPGPRPQSREAGILMLADGVEAAARTLSDPSFDRIQGMVQKMINKVFASGELDECDLTLKDLHSIAKCFTRVLTGIYHQRVAYAEPAEKGRTGEEQHEDEKTNQDGDGKEGNKENLKRLGL